jgi:hypothetical protein
MVKFWDDQKDIKLAIAEKLLEISRRDDLKGWIRPVDGINIPSLTEEIARLSKENGPSSFRVESNSQNCWS